MKYLIILAGALGCILNGFSAVSNPVGIIVHPEKSSFWQTATNSTVQLPIDFPDGASAATLVVEGMHFAVTVPGITESSCVLVLPEPGSPGAEDFYKLTLSFDNGTTCEACFAVICGVGIGMAENVQIRSSSARKWPRVGSSAVIPVPYGATELTIDGEAVDTTKRWCAWKKISSGSHTLYLSDGLDGLEAVVERKDGAITIFLR